MPEESNREELDREQEIGRRLARELVEHLQRMHCGGAFFTIEAKGGSMDGEVFIVSVDRQRDFQGPPPRSLPDPSHP